MDHSELDKFFKFKVGQFVKVVGSPILKADVERHERIGWSFKEQIQVRILERVLQECPGGVQVHYRAQYMNRIGHTNGEVLTYHELQLAEVLPEELEGVKP